jgi:hypothetical protein
VIPTAAERKALSMDLMQEAIAELKRHLKHYVLGTIVLGLPPVALLGFVGWKWITTDFTPANIQLWAGIWSVVFALTFNQFLYGACRSTLKSRSGEKLKFSDFFADPFTALGPVLFANLATALSLIFGLLACLVGGLATSALFFLALPAAVSGKHSGADALRWSWKTLKRDFLTAFAICNIVHLAAVSGVFVACIGGFLTLALYPIAQAILYCRLQEANDAPLASASSSI